MQIHIDQQIDLQKITLSISTDNIYTFDPLNKTVAHSTQFIIHPKTISGLNLSNKPFISNNANMNTINNRLLSIYGTWNIFTFEHMEPGIFLHLSILLGVLCYLSCCVHLDSSTSSNNKLCCLTLLIWLFYSNGVNSHTFAVCNVVSQDGKTVDLYAHSWHAFSEFTGPKGGVLLTNPMGVQVRYNFTSIQEHDITKPLNTAPSCGSSGTGICDCSVLCGSSSEKAGVWQKVTVTNLVDGNYTVTSTTDSPIETPAPCAPWHFSVKGSVATSNPSISPSGNPTQSPTTPSDNPTLAPTIQPSPNPTKIPSIPPTDTPSTDPTKEPTPTPTNNPTNSPTLGPTDYPSREPTYNPSVTPTNKPTYHPTYSPLTPTISPSPYPTSLTRNMREFKLTLFGHFDDLVSHLSHTNISTTDWAFNIIKSAIELNENYLGTYLDIIIISVRKGSILIDYQLQVNNMNILDLAVKNINSTKQITDKITNFSFPVLSNTLITTNPTPSPSYNPSTMPTTNPTIPTMKPTQYPTKSPTLRPSRSPLPIGETHNPSVTPTSSPTKNPSYNPSKYPTTNPTFGPTNHPTLTPTLFPTRAPSYNPSKYPTTNPTPGPTNDPTLTPTEYPTKSPTLRPSRSPLPIGETHNPSVTPTFLPTVYPSYNPSKYPTTYPTFGPTDDPTLTPTLFPTQAPTPIDVFCNDREIKTEFSGDWEYYLHIQETSVVTFDTCNTLSLFDMFISDVNSTGKNYSCYKCGSICVKQAQFSLILEKSIYLLEINDKHAFKIKCASKPDTNAPTYSQITLSPTKTPTEYPTSNPITMYPTKSKHPFYKATFIGDGVPISSNTWMSDPYGRFQAYIEVDIYDPDNALKITAYDINSFIWQYKQEGGKWNDIDHANNDDISVSVSAAKGIVTVFKIQLVVQSIRRLNAGNCIENTIDSRIFKPESKYELRLKFSTNKKYDYPITSAALNITTNGLPTGGYCVIQNIDNLMPLQRFNLFCDGWKDQEKNALEFNALIHDVYMNKTNYVDDARKLTAVAPVGNVSITVLIKEKNQHNAITCFNRVGKFRSIGQVIDDILRQKNITNGSTYATINTTKTFINELLDDVSTQINEASLSENPGVAVSIITVVDDIYTNNLTTKNKATLIVDEMVDNIIDGSGVLDVVISVKNNSDNIAWVVLNGEDIITELTTISSITSNKDIVDAETTTTTLVDTYLPQIFQAIDIFIDIQTSNNQSNDSSHKQKSVFQDQLYIIAQQSQDLIENLETTLQTTIDAIEDNSDNTDSPDDDTISNELVDSLNSLAQKLVDYASLAASKALSNSEVGETFNYETIEYNDDGTVENKKVIVATKFDTDLIDFDNFNSNETSDIQLPKCGSFNQNVILPISFLREQQGQFDCAFMSSTRNNFVPINNKNGNRTQKSSDIVSVNIYGENSQQMEYVSDTCLPYLITIELNEYNINEFNSSMSFDETLVFPLCEFWNVNDSYWDNYGCFVYNLTTTTVTCGCTHLTSFSLSSEEIIPEANILTKIDWRRLNGSNLIKYPTVWIVCLVLFISFMIICYINPRSKTIRNRSIMAYEDIIYKTEQDEKLWKDISGKEIKYITDYMPNQDNIGHGITKLADTNEAKKSLCMLHYKLFKVYLRNDHTLLSLFQRTAGTNFSVKQRLGCFWMYLCIIMVVTGTFYGIEQSTPIKDVFVSFTISLCGTLPVLVVRKLFQKSKPEQVKSTRHSYLELEKPKTIRDELQVIDDEEKESSNEEGVDDTNTTVNGNEMAMDIRSFMAENGEITVADFNKHLEKIYDKENEQQKIRAVSDIRMILFDSLFPLPHYCKRIAWILLILLSIGACITAIVYGLQFDTEYSNHGFDKKQKNYDLYKNNQCWNTTLKLEIESKLTKEWFTKRNNQRKLDDESSFGGNDSKSWLLSIAQSLLTSLILWQPLSVYIVTWIKIWMFSWHLKLALGPSNIILLCKRCCCGYDTVLDTVVQDNNNQNNGQKSMMQMLSRVLSVKNSKYNTIGRNDTQHRRSHKIKDVVAHKNRPVDIISFLGNEVWIIDDTLTTNTNTDVMLSVRNEQELDYVKVKQDNDSCNEELELQQIVNDSNESDDKQSNNSHDDLDQIELRK